MLLKRLANQLPPHLAELLPLLDIKPIFIEPLSPASREHKLIQLLLSEAADIQTTENVLFTPLSILHPLVPAIPIHLLDELSESCLFLTGPVELQGDQTLEEETKKRTSWKAWGIEGLDLLLEEWDGIGVLEISGPKRVGKSLLALHAALRILLGDRSARCTWINTAGAFNANRAREILVSWQVKDVQNVLERINSVPCFHLDDVYNVLSSVESELASAPGSSNTTRTKVLVIDTITSLFKDMLMPSTAQGHAAMISLMQDLAAGLTYSHGVITIVINNSASSVPVNPLSNFSVTTLKPALGTAFTFCPDITLLLQETGKVFGMIDEDERERVRRAPGLRGVVEVLKSRVSPAGRWTVFETDGIRLMDVVPPPRDDERTILMSAGLPPNGVQRPAHGPLAQTMIP